jgi:hypothetical protein
MNIFIFIMVSVFVGALMQGPLWASDPDCLKITNVANNSAEAKSILRNIENIIKERLNEKVKVKYRTIQKAGPWLIVEFDSDILEPGIFVLEQTANTYRWAAEFGGGSQRQRGTRIRL